MSSEAQQPLVQKNVLGQPLETCGADPVTGFFRDGCCHTSPEDLGIHTVCCIVTEKFLAMSAQLGNDLSTPMPQYGFPGLRPGDRWCVCAPRWLEVQRAGAACPVVLEATHEGTLEIVPFEILLQYAVIPQTLQEYGVNTTRLSSEYPCFQHDFITIPPPILDNGSFIHEC